MCGTEEDNLPDNMYASGYVSAGFESLQAFLNIDVIRPGARVKAKATGNCTSTKRRL